MDFKFNRSAIGLCFVLSSFGAAWAAPIDPAEALRTEAQALAVTIDAGLQSRCAATKDLADQSPPLNDMVQFIATSTAGKNITVTYQGLVQVQTDQNLCPTGRQAIALAKQLAVASICESPEIATRFPELTCGPGAVASNGPPATFLTGGTPPATGSGY